MERLGESLYAFMQNIRKEPSQSLSWEDSLSYFQEAQGFERNGACLKLGQCIKRNYIVRTEANIVVLGKRGKQILEDGDKGQIVILKDRKSTPTGSKEQSKKKTKKELSEIIPIPFEREENISIEAESFAASAGKILDQNQMYRDYLKDVLNQIANMLGATVVYTREEKQDGRSNKN